MAAKKTTAETSETTGAKAESTYTKSQLLKSRTYAKRKYLLQALLNDGQSYTKTEVDALIEAYMKGKVK